jgi:hypothetical protein
VLNSRLFSSLLLSCDLPPKASVFMVAGVEGKGGFFLGLCIFGVGSGVWSLLGAW